MKGIRDDTGGDGWKAPSIGCSGAEPTAGAQHPIELGSVERGLLDLLEHHPRYDQIERAVGERQARAGWRALRAVDEGIVQHHRIDVEADDLSAVTAQAHQPGDQIVTFVFGEAAPTRAEVEHQRRGAQEAVNA